MVGFEVSMIYFCDRIRYPFRFISNGAAAAQISYFEHDPVWVLHEIRETQLLW